ncbi:hypothetical protein [Streptomyces sp. NRRL F-4489]|uniref:hypothetical protein n=1 Tax=Streptomyces sp. NRRL F-4489 TaxID=1609095 RepID=UPI000A63CB49|nr:hypothetical protein [Streptomyces sp. NRRL F-4489]
MADPRSHSRKNPPGPPPAGRQESPEGRLRYIVILAVVLFIIILMGTVFIF